MSETTDTLTSGNDVWPANGVANWGDNTVYGVGGDDSISGGSNDDYLDGGAGNDTLLGGTGDDVLVGGDGNDVLSGGSNDDTLIGGAGNDVFDPGTGNAYISLGAGNDSVFGVSNSGVTYIDGTGGGTNVIRIDANLRDYWDTIIGGADSVDSNGNTYNSIIKGDGYTVELNHFHGHIIFNNATLEANCFVEGTRIMTSDGERRIESLRVGDLVVTASGRGAPLKPVLWVGRREVDLETHPRAEDVAPILIMPGALGEGMPHRPLRVSPDHALLVEGELVPAMLLVDDEMIVQLPARGRVTYFHVELDTHEIVLAEGAPSESYIDLGNRSAFDNAGLLQMLHADFSPKREGGMPRTTEGPALVKARMAVARQAAVARSVVAAPEGRRKAV